MRRLLVVVLITYILDSVFALDLTIKGSCDLIGTMYERIPVIKETFEFTIGPGLGISFEVTDDVGANFSLGVGLEYQFPRRITEIEGWKVTDDRQFNFAPVYILLKIHPALVQNVPFGKIQVGYNVLYGGDKLYKFDRTLHGGLHYGFGGGLILGDDAVIEVLFCIYQGSGKIGRVITEEEYSKISISCGYKFTLATRK